MQGIFDSHAHYDDVRFEADREQVLATLPEKGVTRVLNIGADMQTSAASVLLAQKYSYIYSSVGIHPHEAKTAQPSMEAELTAYLQQDKVVAIGEIGLDYYYDMSPRDLQMQVFERQLALAVKLGVPVVIHDRDAHADTVNLLKQYRPKGIVHCFSGSVEMAKQIVEIGMYIGFTGVVTFKNARKTLEVVQYLPLDRLLIETDCPYMAPEPYRGQRCDSSMLTSVVNTIAGIKNKTPQQIIDITFANASEVLGIDAKKL